jgi:polyphosphate kinase
VWRRTEWEEVFEAVRHRDYMLHHPFDSFTSVETMLMAAVRDPSVVASKMTLYRIGHDSPLIDLLVEAAEAGKQVAVLVELKARFDERNNTRGGRHGSRRRVSTSCTASSTSRPTPGCA